MPEGLTAHLLGGAGRVILPAVRQQLFLLSMLAASLSACSLINSYDDVVTGNAGGGSTSTTTAGTGGSGGTGSGTGGATTTTGSGGGGAPPTAVSCMVSGQPFVVEDLSTAATDRYYRDGTTGYQPNGNQIAVFFRRYNGGLHGLLIDTTSHTVNATYDADAWDVSQGRAVGANGFGLVVSRPVVNGQYPIDLIVFGNNFGNPQVFPISDGGLTPTAINSSRIAFAHRGPALDDIDLALRIEEASSVRAVYHRHDAGSLTTNVTELVPPQPFADGEEATPRGIVRTGDGKVHAFMGSPSMLGSGGTRQWTFLDTANMATGPTSPGGAGYILLDVAKASMTETAIAYGHIGANFLRIESAVVPDTGLAGLMGSSLNQILSLGSFLEVPGGSDPRIQSGGIIFAGSNQTHDKIIMILGRVDGGMAYHEPNLFQPEAGTSFGDASLFVTNSPISSLGGIGYLVYTERHDPGANQYDVVKVATIACQKQ